jgi:hypothetical protein
VSLCCAALPGPLGKKKRSVLCCGRERNFCFLRGPEWKMCTFPKRTSGSKSVHTHTLSLSSLFDYSSGVTRRLATQREHQQQQQQPAASILPPQHPSDGARSCCDFDRGDAVEALRGAIVPRAAAYPLPAAGDQVSSRLRVRFVQC